MSQQLLPLNVINAVVIVPHLLPECIEDVESLGRVSINDSSLFMTLTGGDMR